MIYKLYNTCLVTTGVSRSLIIDTEKNNYFFIPNTFAELILENNGLIDVKKIVAGLDQESQTYFSEYCRFLQDNDLVFEVSSKKEGDMFIAYPTDFFTPFEITNAIITVSWNTINNLVTTLEQVKDLRIQHVELRVVDDIRLSELDNLVDLLHGSQAKAIEIYISHDGQVENELSTYLNRFLKVIRLYLYKSSRSAPAEKDARIIYITTESISEKHCGVVSEYYFSPNALHYTESLRHNSCLNRKISIDINGKIKNCPSMKESYGNISDTTLSEALNKSGFKKYWNINKDQIAVCKDCEFRYVCTDCRAYLEIPQDAYSKPLKCGYDPYTCQWEEWSTNPIKQKAIEFYGFLFPRAENT